MKTGLIKRIPAVIALLLAAMFCVLWTHDHSSGLELSVSYPDYGSDELTEAVDDEEVAVSLAERVDHEYTYAWNELETVGIRISAPEAEGKVTVTVLDEKGGTLSGSLPISSVNVDGYTYVPIAGRVSPGLLRLSVSAEGGEAQIYNRIVYDEAGKVLYDGPQVKLMASSFSERRVQGLILLVFLALILIYAWCSLFNPSWERLFVIQYILFGIVFMMIYAPLAEPDAGNHFKRVLSITQGHPVGLPSPNGQIGDDIAWPEDWEVDDNVNLTLYDTLESMDFHMNEEPVRRLDFTNIALYSPFSYTAPVIGAFIARLFTDRLIAILFSARLANLVITGFLLYMAVKITPFGKRYILWITMLPMFMQQAVGVAPDSMLTALVILILAISLKYRQSGERLTGGIIALLYLLTFLLSQYKIVYLLFASVVLLIPWQCFGTKGKYAFHAVVMGGFTAFAALFWFKISSGMLSTGYALADSQTEKLFTRPVEYALAVFRTYATEGASYMAQLLGRNLGSFAFETEPTVLLVLLILFVFEVMAVRKYSHKSDAFTKGLLLFVMLFTTLLITTAEYIQWNDGINLVKGIQGRYFLPFLFPAFVILCGDDTAPQPSPDAACCHDHPAMFVHGVILICFIPQILLYYIYGTL